MTQTMTRQHTILVVDDEPDVVRSVQDLLRLDYRVLGATRAAEGLELLKNEPIHVVMTDQRMPETTGVEFLSHCRTEYPEAIRLLFTGYADLRAVIEAINQGNVFRYIAKPWDPDELQTVIREAVERYDLLAERQRLTTQLRKTNTDLQLANAQLQQANELKTAFIRVASHELRTPLTILLGLCHLARGIADLPPPMPDWLARIDQSAQRLRHLVDQLVSMLWAGQFDRSLRLEPVEVAVLVREAADDVRPFVELRRQRFEVRIEPADLGLMRVDAGKIRDCLNHLLLNAIKFTPDGGQIALEARRGPDGGALLRVIDTGTGIDPQHLHQMFEPFFTGFDVLHHASGQYEFGRQGMGLGLSIVRSFVEMHGGSVSVQSEVGRGSTFTIRLPDNAANDTAEPAPQPEVPGVPPPQTG